jgi:hypothetical protein
MGEERALKVGPSGIEVAYERFGDTEHHPVLLVQGVAAQDDRWCGQRDQHFVDGDVDQAWLGRC